MGRNCRYRPDPWYRDILFRTSAEALQQLARDPRFVGGEIGMVGVLHTWSRLLIYHPHIHYVVPGGARSHCQAPARPFQGVRQGQALRALRPVQPCTPGPGEGSGRCPRRRSKSAPRQQATETPRTQVRGSCEGRAHAGSSLKPTIQRKRYSRPPTDWINVLSVEATEDPGEALLDFHEISDLSAWLDGQVGRATA